MRYTLVLAYIIISISVFSQENTQLTNKLVTIAQEYFEAKQWLEAASVYKEALESDEKNMRVMFNLAECYRNMQDYEAAEYYYAKIAAENDIRYPLGAYYQALMQKNTGRYDEAMKGFKDFREFMVEFDLHEDDRYRDYYKQTKVEIDGCQLAVNQRSMVHPEIGFGALQKPINSPYNDYAAVSLSDDNQVYLTSARSRGKQSLIEPQFGESFTDLFRFDRSGNTWEEVESDDRFEKMINSRGGEGSGTFNRDQTQFYYTNCNEFDGTCQIYTSKLTGGRWSEPIPLNKNINKNGSSARHPSLSQGGDTLFFASDMKGSYGGWDLWMSLNAGNDKWGPAINLGPEINTSRDEISPTYFKFQQALVFASNGHRGFGGYDIYVARGAEFESAEIYNAGLPFNDARDDVFFSLGAGKGFISSNRELDESLGKFDIYQFDVTSKEALFLDISGENTIAGRSSLFTDDYNFDNSETNIINQIISKKLSSSISDVEMVLTRRELAVYNVLGRDDLERIDRIVDGRIKQMTANMMESIRSEDDYYYKQLSLDKRKKVDNIVTAYLEQQGLGNSVTLSKDVFRFYNDVETEEREKIDIVVSERLKIAEDYVPSSPNYNSFNEREQLTLDAIAMKLIRLKKNLGDLRLDTNEKYFLRDQVGNEQTVFQALRERLITLSGEEENAIGESEKELYDQLSQTEITSLNSLANAYMISDADELGNNLKKEDLDVFKGRSLPEQDKLNKIILQMMTNFAKSSTYTAETSFTESELQSAVSDDAQETLNNLLEIRPDLDYEQVRALQRFVNTTYDSYLEESEGVFFDEPSSIVTAPGLVSGDPTARIDEDDLSQYNALSDDKKRLIDNLIGLDYLTEIFYNRGKKLRDEAELTRIPKAERVHIAILGKKISGQEIKDFEKPFLTKAFTHYGNLSEPRKAFFNRIVLDDAFDMRNGQYVLSDQDASLRGTLTESEMALMARIKKFRFNNERVLTENLAVEAKDVDAVPIDIIAIAAEVEEENKAEQLISTADIFAMEESGEIRIALPIEKIDGYSEITITGQLVGDTSDDPLSSFPITLVAFDDEATVVEGYTDEDGFFGFTVNPRKYDIRFQQAAVNEGVNLAAFNVEGRKEKDETTFVNNTRAFFDVNSFELRSEARALLKEIARAYRNSGKKIEIESHTDATGTAEYNLQLSKDRGYAARDYLIENGLDKSDISVIWHGAGKPIASNDDPFGRQLNRRLDIRLIGRNEKNFGSFYLVRPGTTLSKLSESFGIPIAYIRRLNGMNGEVVAYQPIRIKTGRSAVAYDLVVPADIQAGTEFTYTVMEGDDLQKVSRKFNVSESVLMQQNKLSKPDIRPGMKLIIYPKN